MPPKPVKRDSSATQGRYSPLSIPAFKPPVITCPPPVDVPPETPTRAAETVKNVYKTYMTSLSSDVRAQSLYAVFSDLANELEGTEHFSQLIQRIADNLHAMGFTPSALPTTPSVALPCALNHDPVTVTVTKEIIKEVLIPADPVTITITKEVHPMSCTTEMKKLRKELSDLKSGISSLYHNANHTHTAEPLVSSPSPSPSPSAFDSSLGSNNGNNDSSIESVYDNTDTLSSVFSTPKVNHKPLPVSLPPKSFANAAKTNVASTRSPKEIIRDRAAKSCTNKGTPSNILVLSDFKVANTAESYKRIAETRKNVNDTLVENKCKSISWSSRGNLVTKCAKPLYERQDGHNQLSESDLRERSYCTPFDNNDFNIMIQQNEKWSDVNITNGPSIVIKKDTPNAKKATIKIGFNDDKHSTTAKRLLKTTILFGGTPIRCKPWTSVPPAPSRKRAPNASASSDAGVSSFA
ncbi:hypothetical protein M378DRAFT_17234 [Amanita muscaria Koide BX008]|uniref:Uncharacterized protein n=1 Tax=Amanita muscaria (strain Koide BX008) TaxID=946122 RepID=A0A0C2SQH1_AMAMK|nr:hypothetical protein M378DRAFT_17234 [Amanita muscaria Koide BX008]